MVILIFLSGFYRYEKQRVIVRCLAEDWEITENRSQISGLSVLCFPHRIPQQ